MRVRLLRFVCWDGEFRILFYKPVVAVILMYDPKIKCFSFRSDIAWHCHVPLQGGC